MKHGVDLRHLTYFVCLADELHFGRAAERLGIAQAPLSQQIKILEERLGARLFDRTTRRVRLTPAGDTFLDHARQVLDSVDRAVIQTRAMSGQTAGRIAVGGVHVALTHFLPAIILEFRKNWPAVIVDIVPISTGDQIHRLERGELQVGLIRDTESAGFINTRTLAREGFVALLPLGHPLAEKDELVLADFHDQPLIGYTPVLGASYSGTVTTALRRAGINVGTVQDCSRTIAIATLVGAGIGLSIVPSWVGALPSPFITCRPVVDLPPSIDLCVAWMHGESSPMVLDFVATAERVCATQNLGAVAAATKRLAATDFREAPR